MALTGDTTSGTRLLPDVGTLSYNGVVFTCLFKSSVDGKAIRDNADRTIKFVEWTILVEGYVTLDIGKTTIDDQMVQIKSLLNQQAGTLTYSGKGLGSVVVNPPLPAAGAARVPQGLRDVAWGPKPEVLSFQPLGGSRSARVRWTVTTRLPVGLNATLTTGGGNLGDLKIPKARIVQFNEETSLSYDEDCYSTISIKGTLEIAMTRLSVNNRNVPDHVDFYRKLFMNKIAENFDLSRFRVTRRTFACSRDERTMEWEFHAEELPPMGLPPWATTARGRMTVRPFRSGPNTVKWVCSLTGTYIIRPDFTRRLAWAAFLSLWNFRMEQSEFGFFPDTLKKGVAEQDPDKPKEVPPQENTRGGLRGFFFNPSQPVSSWRKANQEKSNKDKQKEKFQLALPVHFGFDEGLYLDSKTITFEASWWLFTAFSHILEATGVWKVPKDTVGGNLWANTVKDIMGYSGNLINQQVPFEDVIVDLGGP